MTNKEGSWQLFDFFLPEELRVKNYRTYSCEDLSTARCERHLFKMQALVVALLHFDKSQPCFKLVYELNYSANWVQKTLLNRSHGGVQMEIMLWSDNLGKIYTLGPIDQCLEPQPDSPLKPNCISPLPIEYNNAILTNFWQKNGWELTDQEKVKVFKGKDFCEPLLNQACGQGSNQIPSLTSDDASTCNPNESASQGTVSQGTLLDYKDIEVKGSVGQENDTADSMPPLELSRASQSGREPGNLAVTTEYAHNTRTK